VKTLLVLAQHPGFVDAVRSGLNPEDFRVVHRDAVEDAEPLLAEGVADACVLDAEIEGVQAIWAIEKLKRRMPRCPIVVCTGRREREWEEEAYVHGVDQILNKPVRGRLLEAVLNRILARGTPARTSTTPAQRSPGRPAPEPGVRGESAPSPAHTLHILRDFSGILSHSLCAEALLREFLVLLRRIIGINRATVFLRQPAAAPGFAAGIDARLLQPACSIGLSPELVKHLELTLDSGVGGFISRFGRILRKDSVEALADPEVEKELELLGAQVAIPVLDRDTLVGVAVFDGRVTGEPLANGELELIFHLLEQVGLAIRNIWLHDQLSASHETMADVLRQLGSACIVVGRDLNILHANRAARTRFGRAGKRGEDLEFSDLPEALGSKLYQVLKTGAAIGPFRYVPEDSPGTVYSVSIVPLQKRDPALPVSALLVAEDQTQREQFQRLEIETANLRLVRTMAERLAHEVGNSLVPLSTHQQLLAKKYEDPEFRASLEVALSDSVKRITRLTEQMRFLARDAAISAETFPLSPLVEEAYQEAVKYQPVKSAQLKYNSPSQPVTVAGDRASLKHALAEVMLNALQANPVGSKISVRMHSETDNAGMDWVHIEVQDNGAGFAPEIASRVPEPFFTTRNVGLGLGLTVTRKIVETHRGRVEIEPSVEGQSGIVRISLPVNAP
jgi:signal transduction histidine kinase/DNA-binding NarL/FixJ family response regulator